MNSGIICHFKKLLEYVRINHMQYIYKQIIIVCNKALNTIDCKKLSSTSNETTASSGVKRRERQTEIETKIKSDRQ